MIIAIDQSLSKCAIVVLNGSEIVSKEIIRTGSASVKTRKKGVVYFHDVHDQINFIVTHMLNTIVNVDPTHIVFEALAFGASGNATRDLACLYGAMRSAIEVSSVITNIYPKVHEISPSALKKYARDLLPENEQFEKDSNGEYLTLASKRKGGDNRKLIKMDKKLMVRAVELKHGEELLSDYNYSNGKDDLADAILIGEYANENFVR